MDLELAGKTAIVTGGSRGIGKAIARQLAREGVDVAIVATELVVPLHAPPELGAAPACGVRLERDVGLCAVRGDGLQCTACRTRSSRDPQQ